MNEDERPIAIVQNSRVEIRATLVAANGHQYLNLREWFPKNGEMRPGEHGLRVRLTSLPDLADVIALALTKARERGLIR